MNRREIIISRRELIKKALQAAVVAPVAISTIEANTSKAAAIAFTPESIVPRKITVKDKHLSSGWTYTDTVESDASIEVKERISAILSKNSPLMEEARQMGARSHNTKTGIFTDVFAKS